jgi:hypothetical protein
MKTAALQQAIYSKLSGDVALSELLSVSWGLTPIFADVPEVPAGDDSYFPYVTFGKDTSVPWDTKSDLGANATFQVDAWSRAGNYTQVKSIADRIYSVLHYQSLLISGADNVLMMCESQSFDIDPDGSTRRALMLFRCMYDGV